MLSMANAATDRRAQNFKRFFEEAGWNVELIAPATKVKRGPRRFFEYHRKLKQMVASRSVDVVLPCELFSLSAARWMKRKRRVKLLIYDAREVYTELPDVARKPIAKWTWRWLERRGLTTTDLVLATGPRDIQTICDIHHFLPRPILVRNLPWKMSEIQRDRSLLIPYGIPTDAKVLVYLGGLQEGRGLHLLLSVVPFLPKDIHVLLIGDGILRSKLEHLAFELGLKPIVHFAGALPSEVAIRLVAACDVGISLIEPISRSYELALPSKLFEYMMCGIPVVSSRLEQVVDLFEKEEWITFTQVSDPNSIRQGIEHAIVNEQNSTFRDRERSLALSEYHFEHDAAMLLTIMDKLLPS
ncbi:MAG TPA: glycosyltransferase [Candidatus Kapabacteria bacterium]|nr:glycosyltransferase [Candidatus Kapabacteria bacterium]